MFIGSTLKMIREDKGFTQKFISKDIMTQGSYSKFENLNSDIGINSFSEVLNRIELSYDELLFIHNGYNYSTREEIMNKFLKLTFNDPLLLNNLIKDIDEFVCQNGQDHLLLNIKKISIALKVLMQTKDIEKARSMVIDIWEDFSKRNHLYISDIYLLNSIMFIFPLETCIEIKRFLFRCISQYKNFKNIEVMKINCSLNISMMFIKNGMFQEALDEIEDCIQLCKTHEEYLRLGVCYVRKGICLTYLTKKDRHSRTEDWIDKGFKLLEMLEARRLLESVTDEVARLKKS